MERCARLRFGRGFELQFSQRSMWAFNFFANWFPLVRYTPGSEQARRFRYSSTPQKRWKWNQRAYGKRLVSKYAQLEQLGGDRFKIEFAEKGYSHVEIGGK